MTAALVALALLPAQTPPDLETMCPLMNNRPTNGRMAAEYAGFRIFVCCDQCLGRIGRSAKQVVANAQKRGALIGDFMFDPVTGLRAEPKQAKTKIPHAGFIYYNTQNDRQDYIGETEKNLARIPEKECLACPVEGTEFKWTAKSGAFADHEGIRYYLCGKTCRDAFIKNPQTTKVQSKITVVVAKPYPVLGIGE